MRRICLTLMLLLAACQMTLPGGGAKAPVADNPITGAAIEVSTLDTPRPGPRPETDAPAAPAPDAPAADPAAPEPEPAVDAPAAAPKSAGQIACEKTRGTWSRAGKTGTMLCIRPTRDSGKQCRKGTDCDGLCLARSGTCAPIAPMFGCNEILQDDGQRVTLCID